MPFISVQDYLEGELQSEVRHDYFAGQVYAMAGASAAHEDIAMALASDLYVHLEGKPCRPYKGDLKLKLRVNNLDTFYYPDIMVACDPADNHRYYREKPTVLIEILSDDIERDLVQKYLLYRTISSLEEYIVLSQDPDQPRAYVYRRSNDWEQEIIEAGGTLEMRSLGFSQPIERAYRSVTR